MKTCLWSGVVCAVAFSLSVRADIIAQWNFNGSEAASFGQGTATLIGGTTSTFATGSTNDPATSGNQGWNLAHFPTQSQSNKMAGVQFNASTLGYSQIEVRWDQKVSGTASKFCRFQYSADGVNFYDAPIPVAMAEVSSSSSYFEPQTNSLVFIPEAEDNPNFAFRIVTEFENTALGYGLEEYVTTYGTNGYRTTGTIRFDMVTLTGERIPGANTPPQISSLSNQTLRVNGSTPYLSLIVSDAEDAPESLAVLGSSSNQSVVPDSNIQLSGSGSERAVTVTAGSEPGLATINLAVVDTGALSNSVSFVVVVLPENTPPSISPLSSTNTLPGVSVGPLAFTIGDLETDADLLTVSAASANPALLPSDTAHITFGGSGSNRTVSLLPVQGQSGVAPVTIEVSDGGLTSASSFALLVNPSPSLVLCESFAYPDGSLLTNSGFLWDNRSGTYGQCQVTNGQLVVASTQTEDVLARLAGAPYVRSNGTVLYSSFKLRFLGVPKSTPDYFAHFVGGTALRARVFAEASESMSDAYHLLIANGSTTNALYAASLFTNNTYTVVTRYDIDNASSALWVNPHSENDPAAIANDAQSPVTITSYGFRQDSGLGAVALIDDLKVGLTFASVTQEILPTSIPLGIKRSGGNVVLTWADPSCLLQSSTSLTQSYADVPGATSPYTNHATTGARFFRLHRLTK